MTTRTSRPGLSLTEVLAALFIMALGTIAILTMFPFGALQMGQALKDDRCAQAAAAADYYMKWYWKTNVAEPDIDNPALPRFGSEPFFTALDDPNANTFAAPRVAPITATTPGPSYPVFVDPMGFVAPWSAQNAAAQTFWVGNQSTPRRSLTDILRVMGPPANATNYPQRVCSLRDGFGYAEGGFPNAPNNVVECELRYNWLWVVQRPNNANRYTANQTVVVFDKRAFQFAPQNAEAAFVPVVNNNAGLVGATSVSFPANTQLGVVKGGWIADVTVNATAGVRNAAFYRVVTVTDNGTSVDVELQTPIADLGAVGPLTANQRTFIVPAGVAEVFVRPSLTVNDF